MRAQPAEQFISTATFSVPAALILTAAAFAQALWHLCRGTAAGLATSTQRA